MHQSFQQDNSPPLQLKFLLWGVFEELAIFDLLTRPEVSLTKAEEREVKKVAKDLLQSLKREKLVLDWKKRQTTRAAVRYTIETLLDELPRKYTPELYQQKCDSVYQHIFDMYNGQGNSFYVAQGAAKDRQ